MQNITLKSESDAGSYILYSSWKRNGVAVRFRKERVISRFQLLAAYAAEGLATRDGTDAREFHLLMPNEGDSAVVDALLDHALVEFASLLSGFGWRIASDYSPEGSPENTPLTESGATAAVDRLARRMVADWIMLRGRSPLTDEQLELNREDLESAEQSLRHILTTISGGRKARRRRIPPI